METNKWTQRNGDREMETRQRCGILFNNMCNENPLLPKLAIMC